MCQAVDAQGNALPLQDPQGGIAVAQGLLAASDAAEALRANIAEEQQLHNDFLCSVHSVLEPMQSAIAIVHVRSYPSFTHLQGYT